MFGGPEGRRGRWYDEAMERMRAVGDGLFVERLTVGWMIVEALVALWAGVLAHSVLLIAFGVDSLIELVSGGVVLWRLSVEAAGGDATAGGALDRVERAERRAAWIVGISLAMLCAYIVVTAAWGLITGGRPEASPVGLALAVAAVVAMPLLARAKRRIAAEIGSAALRGDAASSLTCGIMAGAMLVGLAANAALGWRWAEYVAALAFLRWLVPEAREALEAARGGEGGCGCGAGAC